MQNVPFSIIQYNFTGTVIETVRSACSTTVTHVYTTGSELLASLSSRAGPLIGNLTEYLSGLF